MSQKDQAPFVADAPISIVTPTIDLTPDQQIDLTANQTIDLGQAEQSTASAAVWNTTPITAYPHSTVAEVQALMDRFTISGVPIVDALGRLVGIITRRDLRFLSPSSAEKTMLEIMTREVVKVPEGTTVTEARTVLQEHRIERVPMVDQNDTLLGILSAHDFSAVDLMAKAVPVNASASSELDSAESHPEAKQSSRPSVSQIVAASLSHGPNLAEQVRALTFSGANAIVIEGVETAEQSNEIAALREAYPAVRFTEASA